MELTASHLRDVLDYDPETGVFVWRVDRNQLARVGDRAGYTRHDGYLILNLRGRGYLGHRLAWLHVYGEWPEDMIDHINGDPSDNRLANLRPATRSQNMMNLARLTRSTSGHKGVSLNKSDGKWEAHITVKRRKLFLGRYENIEDAIAARRAAEAVHFGAYANAALRALARPHNRAGVGE